MWKLSAEKPEKTSAKNGYRMGIKWVYKIPSPEKQILTKLLFFNEIKYDMVTLSRKY